MSSTLLWLLFAAAAAFAFFHKKHFLFAVLSALCAALGILLGLMDGLSLQDLLTLVLLLCAVALWREGESA